MADEAVQVIPAADRHRSVATLMLAFVADPIVRWAWPDAHSYSTYWPGFVEAFGGRAFDHGTAHGVEDLLGVALWLPPGVEPDAETLMGLVQESMSDRGVEEVAGLFEQMDELHPTGDHWYLPLTGVDPPAQGRRLGSKLLEHALAICDTEGLPAYLEATSPRSRNLYARHGFKDVGVIQAGSSPEVWAMLREPAA
jgi:GNAT superfamily N-acetyltransferase